MPRCFLIFIQQNGRFCILYSDDIRHYSGFGKINYGEGNRAAANGARVYIIYPILIFNPGGVGVAVKGKGNTLRLGIGFKPTKPPFNVIRMSVGKKDLLAAKADRINKGAHRRKIAVARNGVKFAVGEENRKIVNVIDSIAQKENILNIFVGGDYFFGNRTAGMNIR